MTDLKRNLIQTAKIAGGYLLIFLVGKLFSQNPGLPFWRWLFSTDPTAHTYLFGWLISHGRMFYASLVSLAAALYGKVCFGWITLFGFAIGLPLGEFLGNVPDSYLHFGWAVWGAIFLASCIMGIVLEKFPTEQVNLRSKIFLLWLVVYLLLILASILWVRSQFQTSA